ncbi:hypothetical protein [Methylorubrum podarium]|jgi:hypothetical protein|uniref:hypothetical protein n=1 Tax=Methylorubrum podarium TaxID=200476 RepID=UPI001EE2B6DD|nr:hypothetical protein [Methylorubrum podarium]
MLNGPLPGLVQIAVTVSARRGGAAARRRSITARGALLRVAKTMTTFPVDALERRGVGAVQTA